MSDPLFISYSRKDAKIAQRLGDSLREAGIQTWIDRTRLDAGEKWTDSIVAALERSPAVILVISPDAVRSPWVRKETAFAGRKHKRFIPLICRSTKIPEIFQFWVGEYQWLDFTNKSHEDGIRELVDAIHKLAADESATHPTTPTNDKLFPIHIEDIQEFLPAVPRCMWWRTFTLMEVPLGQRLMRTLLLQPPGLVATWAWVCFCGLIVSLIMPVVFPIPGTATYEFLLDDLRNWVIASIPLALFSWLGSKWSMKRMWTKGVPDAYPDLAYRSDPQTPNKLLDRWQPTVKSIVWQLLEQPPGTWDEYISSRCPDEDLAARVWAAMAVLGSLAN